MNIGVLYGVLLLFALPLFAASSTGGETDHFGNFYTSDWRSGDFEGTALRNWDAAADSFYFEWKTDTGDQIGRIGKDYSSSDLGVRLDDVRSDCVMSTNATIVEPPSATGGFFWSIYGWTYDSVAAWPAPNGYNNEFYIVFNISMTNAQLVAQGYVPIDSVNIDGVIFDCFTNDMPWGTSNQTQWMSVCRSKTWSASVNLKKMFDFWRSKGLANEYVVDLTWAVEAYAGGGSGSGKLQLTDINIPRLASPTSAARPPMRICKQARPQQFQLFTLNGRMLAVTHVPSNMSCLPFVRIDGSGAQRDLHLQQ